MPKVDADLVGVGPWSGINNVEDETSRLYEPGKAQFLREAVNVDLRKDGWTQRRVGKTKLLDFTDAHSGVAIGGMFLVADGNVLKRVLPGSDPTDSVTETLVSNLLGGEVSYAEAGGEVYWCNGSQTGRITQKQATFWGLTPPSTPNLTAAVGGLPAGTYMVALTCESASGIESGAWKAAQIVLTSNAGILVSPITADPNAAYVNIYVTNTNGRDLFWSDRIAANAGTYTIVSLPQSTDVIDRQFLLDVPKGASIVRAFKGYLLVASDNVLYWSQPLAYHLFKQSTDAQLFSSPIILLEPQDDGFFVAEGDNSACRTWWVAGADPESWSAIQVDDKLVSSGMALRIPGRKIPVLQTTSMVSVWATEDGFVAGMSGGRLVHLTEDTVAMNASAKATLLYREQDGLAQILLNLRDKQAASRFGLGDRVTADVIKAGF